MTTIGASSLDVFPLCLGGNVFGWTADKETTFGILDAFTAGGGNLIDTADAYSKWVPGHTGGESERMIGEWLAARPGTEVMIATKVARHPEFPGLGNVRGAAEASLQRLGVEVIDLYYAHYDDPDTPLEQAVTAFAELQDAGLIRAIGLSNFTPDRLRAWMSTAADLGVAAPVALQPEYNLVHRNDVEADVAPIAADFGLGMLPYYGLASGFLTGKYRSTEIAEGASPRAKMASAYATPQGLQILDVMERIAGAHDTTMASVALAWLREQPYVVAPIASASRLEQVEGLLAGATLSLTAGELEELTVVSDWTPVDI
ncbi:aldo/keto reductase [Microbacterium sediminicola]|uniref:Aldo/keto reductase n=1 Tax=Microbacterium sediminicola TaxID=415210 RepID=A0ABN2HXF1_9MICO